jgi:hypothetical protein
MVNNFFIGEVGDFGKQLKLPEIVKYPDIGYQHGLVKDFDGIVAFSKELKTSCPVLPR